MLPPPRFRPDFRRRQRFYRDDRAAGRVLAHFTLERELSDRLRSAPRAMRSSVYCDVYSQLFAALPDHPQHRSATDSAARASLQLQLIESELGSDRIFLEIGCGDAALGFAAARRVRAAYALDVTDALIDFDKAPANFKFLPTGGVDIPLPADAVDIVYSNQLMEHLHPDDAVDQLMEIYRVLRPRGRYFCITPSRVTGPHDVSGYFGYSATGLHLKEYDYGALSDLFRRAGFRHFACLAVLRGRRVALPYSLIRAAERSLLFLPARLRAALTSSGPVQAILGLTVVAAK
jgi:SAM-dependent methyltransferase